MHEKAALLIEAGRQLNERIRGLSFNLPVSYVYNPLSYAWKPYARYLEKYTRDGIKTLFLGMNPGPWGMVQTGIPFGEIDAVKEWLEIEEPVYPPEHLHPKRPVLGFDCERSEVSGYRLWGLMQKRFNRPGSFFKEHFVANYCPLAFFHSSGRNITPDKLKAEDKDPLLSACDEHVRKVISILSPEWCVGVGRFAEKRLKSVISDIPEPESRPLCASILHPSPANPKANRGWGDAVTDTLCALGIWKNE